MAWLAWAGSDPAAAHSVATGWSRAAIGGGALFLRFGGPCVPGDAEVRIVRLQLPRQSPMLIANLLVPVRFGLAGDLRDASAPAGTSSL